MRPAVLLFAPLLLLPIMGCDSSLTDRQKVSVFDAVCDYLSTPGADDNLVVLSETAEGALPRNPTPQQRFDASVAAGWLLGSGACR